MKQMIDESEKYLVHSYNRYPVVLDHGDGVKLYDTDGKEYLDFGAGIAVCALGYGDKEYTDALKAQIDKGIHFSNYFYSEPLLQAAKGLAKATGLDRVFMANSGTEANEGALKMARKYAIMQGHENRHEIISMNKAFHGRSMGALSVTGTAKYREPFEPMLQGVTFADYNDSACTRTLPRRRTRSATPLTVMACVPSPISSRSAGSARTSGSRTASTLQTRSSTFSQRPERAWRTAPFPT